MPSIFFQKINNIFPNFTNKLETYNPSDETIIDGVISLYPIKEIAPKAFLHSFYPALENHTSLFSEYFNTQTPTSLSALYNIFNGATLFHTYIEIWGFKVNSNKFINPAYDIRHENKFIETSKYMIGFASNHCGDVVFLNSITNEVEICEVDGDKKRSFKSIDQWLSVEMEVGYELFKEYIK